MSELRFILKLLGRGIKADDMAVRTDRLIDDAIEDIKNWAKGCVPEEDTRPDLELLERDIIRKQAHNDCRAETLKKVEED